LLQPFAAHKADRRPQTGSPPATHGLFMAPAGGAAQPQRNRAAARKMSLPGF